MQTSMLADEPADFLMAGEALTWQRLLAIAVALGALERPLQRFVRARQRPG
jgi:hypothetical protein